MKKRYWLDSRKNVVLLVRIFLAICVAVLLLDLTYQKHVESSWEGWFGFYGFFGFVGCVALVLIAKELRKLLKRKEDYYDD